MSARKFRKWAVAAAAVILACTIGLALLWRSMARPGSPGPVPLRSWLTYMPRSTPYNPSAVFPPDTVRLTFTTDDGQQTAWFVPPRSHTSPADMPLWLMFHGIYSTAADMTGLMGDRDDPRVGFLFVEYPGFAGNQGTPSARSILSASEGAVEALAGHLRVSRETLEHHSRILGVSMGTATALQYAGIHPSERVVLIAPFTTLAEITRKRAGSLAASVLEETYDNRQRVRELLLQDPCPAIVIIHGDRDDTIPFSMGQDLASIDRDKILFVRVPNATHYTVFHLGRSAISTAMHPGALDSKSSETAAHVSASAQGR